MGDPLWLWPGRVLVAAGTLALIAGLSNLPQGKAPEEARLRLAWRAAGAQVRLCRQRSEAELSRLAPHMRQAEDCHWRTLPYRLAVHLDGEARLERPVESIGAQGDRPLYVQEELALRPGPHRLRIAFAPDPARARQPESIAVENAAQAAALDKALRDAATYRIETTVRAAPGRIVLVELEEVSRTFRIRGAAAPE